MGSIDIYIIDKKYEIATCTWNNTTYYRASDIGKAMHLKNIHQSTASISPEYKRKFDVPTNGGMQSVTYITQNGIKKILCKSNHVNAHILANYFGMDVSNICRMTYEASTISNILKVFKTEEYITQYSVDGKYLVDLYFPKYKLAIECDEKFHEYRKEDDVKRQAYIENALNCKFIRYSPQQKDFDIFQVIHNMHQHMMYFTKSP